MRNKVGVAGYPGVTDRLAAATPAVSEQRADEEISSGSSSSSALCVCERDTTRVCVRCCEREYFQLAEHSSNLQSSSRRSSIVVVVVE